VGIYSVRGVYGEFANRSSGLNARSDEGDHSDRLGLPEPSGNRHSWLYGSEYSTQIMPRMRVIITPLQTDSVPIKELRRLKHLAVVDVELEERKDREPANAADREKGRKIWKRELVGLLKGGPSTENTFSRWKTTQGHPRTNGGFGRAHEVAENEGWETLLEISL